MIKALGFLCSALPGCSDEEFDILRSNSLEILSPSSSSSSAHQFEGYQDFSLRYKSEEIVETLLKDSLGPTSLNIIEPVLLYCSCSQSSAMKTAKMILHEKSSSSSEINNHGDDISVNCEWCGKCYSVSPSSIEK